MTSQAITTQNTHLLSCGTVVPGVVCAIAITGIVLSIIGLHSISCGQTNAMSQLGIFPNATILGVSSFGLILGLVVLTSLTKRKIEKDCQQIQQNHEKKLTKINGQNDRLTGQQNTLKQANSQIREEIKGLKEEKERLEQQLSTLNAEYLHAKQTIQQKALAEKEIQQLEQSKKQLQREIKELENIPERMVTAKKDMELLDEKISARKTQLANLEYDVNQKDYKTQCHRLRGEISRLKSELTHVRREVTSWHVMGLRKH